MKIRFGLFAVTLAVSAMTVACGGADATQHARKGATPSGTDESGGGSNAGGDPGGDPGGAASTPACPTTMAMPTSIALDDKVEDLSIVADKIYFRTGSGVSRMDKTGSGRAQIVTNDNLVHAYADASGLLLVQTTTDGNNTAQLVRATLDGQPQQTINATNLEAFDTKVFASDDSYFYLSSSTTNGDALFKLGKQLPQLVQIANFGVGLEDRISSPQLAGGMVWFVRGKTRVYTITTDAGTDPIGKDPMGAGAPGGGELKEMFGTGDTECKLAVGNSAYCTDGKALVRRDLKGAGATTIFDTTKSAATAAGFGTPFILGDAIWMKPDAMDKGVIRALKPNGASADESVKACGRGDVVSVAVDATSVVWSENGATKGIWIVAR